MWPGLLKGKKKKEKEILLYFKTKLKLSGLTCSPVTLRTLHCVLLEPTQDLSLWYDAAVTKAGLRMGLFPHRLPPTPPHFLSLGFLLGILHTLLIRSEPRACRGSRLRTHTEWSVLQSPKEVWPLSFRKSTMSRSPFYWLFPEIT